MDKKTAELFRRVRVPIGAKFIVLILAALLVTVVSIVLNATGMFKKDNLNSIYISSDLLTDSKSAEVRFWFDSAVKRVSAMGGSLLMGKTDPNLMNDREILFVTVFGLSKSGDSVYTYAPNYAPKKSWSNKNLLGELELTPKALSELQRDLKIRFDKLAVGVPEVKSAMLPTGQAFLLLSIPLVRQNSGRFSTVVVAGIRPDSILKSFADTGPYTLSLVNDSGDVILHKDRELMKKGQNLNNLPIVRRMLTSPLEREFQEFSFRGTDYLGAYAKVGLAGLGVISQVEKSVALETGDLLVKRSVLIALAVLSSVFILAYLLVENIVSPIRKLQSASQDISSGNFKVRVNVKSRDEMFDLAHSFNVMTSEIERKIDNLSKINEACQVISSTLDPKELIEFSADSLMSLTKCAKAYAWFSGPGASAAGKPDATVKSDRNWFKTPPKALERMMGGSAALKKGSPFQFRDGSSDYLVAPLRAKDAVSGCVILGEKTGKRGFAEEDLYMAGTLASSISSTFENINLLNETADKARMEKELETAKHVQDTMFPPTEILAGKFEIQSYYSPAAECGGDWWGCIDLGDNKVLLVIGDATGHGAPAAMITATSKAVCSVLQDFCQRSPTLRKSPHLILRFLNKAVRESAQGKILMTFFAAVLDTQSGEFSYSNASHDPIYVYRAAPGTVAGAPGLKDNLSVLEGEPGPRLGQDPQASYELHHGKLSPGDWMLLYTDGLPEGVNPSDEEWSDRKFMRSIVKHATKNPKLLREGVLADFREFTEDRAPVDDVTLVVCKKN